MTTVRETTDTRTAVLAQAADWLDSLGETDAAYLLRTCDVPTSVEATGAPTERPHPRPCEHPDVTCTCPRPYIASEETRLAARRRGCVAAFFRGVGWYRVAKSAGAL
ncbi:hypothetical protein [Streptomyces sp. NPDC093109]|uniref:hypothetical protein n=1 Tax=Streptomyces sp. NPDC093109 TaxID=3154977 RepID=UPI003450A393